MTAPGLFGPGPWPTPPKPFPRPWPGLFPLLPGLAGGLPSGPLPPPLPLPLPLPLPSEFPLPFPFPRLAEGISLETAAITAVEAAGCLSLTAWIAISAVSARSSAGLWRTRSMTRAGSSGLGTPASSCSIFFFLSLFDAWLIRAQAQSKAGISKRMFIELVSFLPERLKQVSCQNSEARELEVNSCARGASSRCPANGKRLSLVVFPVNGGHSPFVRRGFSFSAARPRLMLKPMLIVHVHVRVKPECVEAFKQATILNARASRKENGIARFDLLQQAEDPARFLLVEAYRTAEAPAAHKETAHYQTWRDAVAEMMAEPRQSVKFANLDPADAEY
jgi:(4S)-4-hydroxy-5-phosphonooxypentane-2,3-dione isomerase